eukprot:4568644-Lingulodinium_polyedra.AAC.1
MLHANTVLMATPVEHEGFLSLEGDGLGGQVLLHSLTGETAPLPVAATGAAPFKLFYQDKFGYISSGDITVWATSLLKRQAFRTSSGEIYLTEVGKTQWLTEAQEQYS